jgi:hypothetical protein
MLAPRENPIKVRGRMEIRFLANIIDQLDFALDHLALADVNYKRLALMLIDNAKELALHAQRAADFLHGLRRSIAA